MPTLLIELIIINNYFLIFLIVSTIGIFLVISSTKNSEPLDRPEIINAFMLRS